MNLFSLTRTLKLGLFALLLSVFSLSTTHAVVPTGTSVSIDEGNFTNTANVNLTLTAAGPASIEMQIDPGSGVFGAWIPFAANTAITLPAGDGLKTVNVNFRDQAVPGDTAGPETDTITLDTAAPTLSPVSIISDNADTTLARSGNTITVSFMSNEVITSVTSTIATETASVTNTGGNNWSATLLLDGNEADGAAPFTIDFQDQAANPGTQVIAVTDASVVTIDNTLPTLSSVSIASNNAINPTSHAKTADTVTVTFTASETITMVSGTISGETATVMNTGGNNWTATLITDGNEAQGNMPITLDFQDTAGNVGTQVTGTTDASAITFDSVTPSATPVSIASNNANTDFAKTGDTVTVSFTPSETLDTSTNGTIDGQTGTIAGNTLFRVLTGVESDGVTPFILNLIDQAGNMGVVNATTDGSMVTIDNTAPVFDALLVTAQDASSSNKTVSPDGNFYIKNGEKLQFALSINPGDTVNTGNNVDFTIGGTAQSTANFISSPNNETNRSRTYTLTTGTLEGAVVVTGLNFTDQAGNAITGFMAPMLNIIADQTAPTLTSVSITSNNAISPNAYAKTNDTVTVAFTSSEPIQNPSATIDGETATVTNVGGNNWEATLLLSGDETEGTPLTFTIDFEDYATNPGTQVSATTDASQIIFDMTDPMITSVNFASDSTFFLGDVPTTYSKSGDDLIITATVNDTISGISMTDATFFLGQTGQTIVPFVNTAGSTWVATYTTNGTEQQGVVLFDATATDNAGNLLTVSATTDGSSTVHDYTNPTLPTTVLDLDGVQTNGPAPLPDQFKHRSKAEYEWSGHEDPTPAGVNVISGLLHFDIDYVHTTNVALSNELGTIVTLPTTEFIPAASLLTPDNDPYQMSMEVFDKAGNGSGKSVVYTQKYTIAIIGTVTDENGKPIGGASIQIAARAGEVCLVGLELCGVVTKSDGTYFALVRDTANYTVSFSNPAHFLAKEDVFIPAVDDVIINPKLQAIGSDHLIQHTSEVVRIKTTQTFTAVDGNLHPTFIDVISLGGQISTKVVDSATFQVSSLSRITSITSNNPHVVITFLGDNTYEVKGAGKISSTGSNSGGEALQAGATSFGTSIAHSSGASRIGTRRAPGSGKTNLRIAGQSRADFQRLNKEFMTYEESKRAVAEINKGQPSQVLAYVNRYGYIVFGGYQRGRLPADKVGKRYQNTVRPGTRFIVRDAQDSIAAQADNLKTIAQREEKETEKAVSVAGLRRSRPGEEFVSVANSQFKKPIYDAMNQRFRYVNHMVTDNKSRIRGKDQNTIKINIGGKKVSVGVLMNR